MILQNTIFPFGLSYNKTNLYYRIVSMATADKDKIIFEKDGICSFDTYLSSFSVGKWTKYTDIQDLFLNVKANGEFTLTVNKTTLKVADTKTLESEQVFSSDFTDNIRVELPLEKEGVYSFDLTAKTDGGEFLGASWETSTELKNNVSICSVVCTYKREQFVKANIAEIEENITNNENSPLYGKFEMIISDNGASFKERKEGAIRIYRNLNAGGAGGFTRGLIEVMRVRKEKGYTHILMMDDDIRFETESIYRTFMLLSYIKDEYSDVFIGGAMFRTDKPNIQNERADCWNYATGKVVPLGHMFNMNEYPKVVENEQEEHINYLSWWYCVMPVDVPQEDNLPLPVFIKRDDIEYGLRNGKHFLTLNGIFCWHEPFEAKRPASIEYYYHRNQGIMECVRKDDFSKDDIKNRTVKEVIRQIMTFRYNEAEATLKGVEDFLKGIDFIKNTDPIALNDELRALNATAKSMDKPGLEEYLKAKKWTKKEKLRAIFTINGWLIPFGKTMTVPAVRPSYKAFLGVKKALNYDFFNKQGYYTKRSYKRAFSLLIRLHKIIKEIDKKFYDVRREYCERISEITNLDFWENYLGLKGDKPLYENTKTPPKPKIKVGKKERLKRRIMLVAFALIRPALRIISLFIPIEKDRVVLYITDRRGFACNLKYVALDLKENYDDRFKLSWVTGFPDTCEEVKANGIEVIKKDTLKYVEKQLRSKVVVYNDSLPPYMPKRKGQVYINAWHGGINYKHIGYDYLADQSKMALRKFELRNPQPDYMVSGCEFFTNDTALSFRFDKSVFLTSGLPRNSLFFRTDKMQKAAKRVREKYPQTEGKRILIYAPTFRFDMRSDAFGLDFAGVSEALGKRFGGEWIIFYRGHGFVKGKPKLAEKVVDVTRYPDMQEIMAASDAMISDYSSAMWDMSFTGRPIFIYAPDMTTYATKDRSFAYPPEEWPYSVAINNEELIDNILLFDEKNFAEKIKEHHKTAGSYEEGYGAEIIAKIINDECTK